MKSSMGEDLVEGDLDGGGSSMGGMVKMVGSFR